MNAKQNNNCTTCTSSKSYIHTNPKYTLNGCSLDWIDSANLKYKFGADYCDGMKRERWFPSWLIEYCPEETKPGDLGYPDPCEKDVYYRLIGGIVYRVKIDCNGKEEISAIKKYLIQDCAIENVSASKIINRCELFKNTTLVKPLEEYKSIINGVKTVNPIYQFLDIVITDDCELKTVYDNRLARRAVLPSLNCLVDYDIASDTTKVNLSKVIDNKTIRVTSRTNNCDTIFSYTYTQDNIEGDGTETSPIIARVKTQDNIEGDGTSANRLIAKVKTDNTTVTGNGTNASPLKSKTFVDSNQFAGDGQSQATQYTLKTCSLGPSYFKLPSFTSINTNEITFGQLTFVRNGVDPEGTGSKIYEYQFELPISIPRNPCGNRWRAHLNIHANYGFDDSTGNGWDTTNSRRQSLIVNLQPVSSGIYLPGTSTLAQTYIQNVRTHQGTDFVRIDRGDINLSAIVDIDDTLTSIRGSISFEIPENATNPRLTTNEHMISLTVLSSS